MRSFITFPLHEVLSDGVKEDEIGSACNTDMGAEEYI
jgi:hypothetical protein